MLCFGWLFVLLVACLGVLLIVLHWWFFACVCWFGGRLLALFSGWFVVYGFLIVVGFGSDWLRCCGGVCGGGVWFEFGVLFCVCRCF